MKATDVIPPTTVRVPVRDEHFERIHQQVGEAVQTSPQAIDLRLEQLDHEWDIDHVYEAAIAVISLIGLVLAPTVSLWWLLLAAFGAISLLSHNLFGWSILLFVFRGMGIRTATEIAYERYALKALRGDFQHIACVSTSEDRDAISTFEGEGGMTHGPPIPEPGDAEVVQHAVEAVQK